jgi:uracil-DNA glycosylase family 4
MDKIYSRAEHPFAATLGPRKKIVHGKGDVEWCKNKILVLFDFPTEDEAANGIAVSSEQNKIVDNVFVKSGVETEKNVYYTYIFKVKPEKNQQITFENFYKASNIVCQEFDLLKPKIVLCFGIFSTTLVSIYIFLFVDIFNEKKTLIIIGNCCTYEYRESIY